MLCVCTCHGLVDVALGCTAIDRAVLAELGAEPMVKKGVNSAGCPDSTAGNNIGAESILVLGSSWLLS